MPDVTELLLDWSQGNRGALDRLMPLVYEELRRLAKSHLARERIGHTLSGTALVHEAYLRLVKQDRVQWQNRAHFFGVAAQMIRRILVDHARSRLAIKRGAGSPHFTLDLTSVTPEQPALDLVALDDALQTLEKLDHQQSRIVELRFFAGLSIEETSEVLSVSPATIKRDWTLAKAWLHKEMAHPA